MDDFNRLMEAGAENLYPHVIGRLRADRAVLGTWKEGGFVLTPEGKTFLGLDAPKADDGTKETKGGRSRRVPKVDVMSDLFVQEPGDGAS